MIVIQDKHGVRAVFTIHDFVKAVNEHNLVKDTDKVHHFDGSLKSYVDMELLNSIDPEKRLSYMMSTYGTKKLENITEFEEQILIKLVKLLDEVSTYEDQELENYHVVKFGSILPLHRLIFKHFKEKI